MYKETTNTLICIGDYIFDSLERMRSPPLPKKKPPLCFVDVVLQR
jgi:hypothetical protein